MRITFSVVPPGGGEQDHSFEAELSALPRPGDYVTVHAEPRVDGAHNFIVRRCSFYLGRTESGPYREEMVVVEVEFALSPCSSPGHKRACNKYAQRGKPAQEFEPSAY
jgi:hypothetical protein